MNKQLIILSGMFLTALSFKAKAYCTPDNDTCFNCGTNCIAELTFENILQEDGTKKALEHLPFTARAKTDPVK